DVEAGERQALAHADFPGALVQNTEIEDQQQTNNEEKAEPHPERLTQEDYGLEPVHETLALSRGDARRRKTAFRTCTELARCGPTSRCNGIARGARSRGR